MKSCHSCGTEWTDKGSPGFSAECPKCAAYLHCCLNCKFYSPGAHHDCREPQADAVREKDRRNTCEYFLFADRGPGGMDDEKRRSQAAREKLEKLFGGGESRK